jgi:uncharacterized protein (DUF983 family)
MRPVYFARPSARWGVLLAYPHPLRFRCPRCQQDRHETPADYWGVVPHRCDACGCELVALGVPV